VKTGDLAAELIVSDNGRELERIPLYAAEDGDYRLPENDEKSGNFITKAKDIFSKWKK
jgi:hypothetical protein